MKELIFTMPGNETLGKDLEKGMGWERGVFTLHRFPDGESQIRIDSPVKGRGVVVLCSLDRPDEKLFPLYLLIETAKDLGANRVLLVAPYLAYLRQDARFRPGEGISSRYFAKWVSSFCDGLVTVDPHLHRYFSLNEIYSIPTGVVSAAPAISRWIRDYVTRPWIIGPDQESQQWVERVAKGALAPSSVLEKVRRGDREVEVSFPQIEGHGGLQPVLVDDIISSGRTMMEAVRSLKKAGFPAPVCIGVHALFGGRAYEELLAAGPREVVTCNTVAHPSNRIDVGGLIREAIKELNSQ